MTACQCREKIDEGLARHNTKVSRFFVLGNGGTDMPWPIATDQIETGRGKKKAVALFASYCPFCGAPLKPESSATQQPNGGEA
ncbi:hypothetical protein [Achromobacter insolitus]|uniref:hypothetical protein n=1 Tax=Achromobacter insolitus TaxID=217204 RepID=UPI0028A756C2|nr:hypothetical protein [Achromobacter insolitus]